MQSKYTLGEERIPKRWYNIAADLTQALPAVLHPGTLMPGGKTLIATTKAHGDLTALLYLLTRRRSLPAEPVTHY